jgi:hypothetical protein
MSPYHATVDELVAHFATSAERRLILQGFLRFRRDLRMQGAWGWQWLDGSFLEDVESQRGRPPNDLDIVTFLVRPASITTVADMQSFVNSNLGLFDRTQTKANYHCDALYVDLALGPYDVVSVSRYYFGLFSHQRVTAVWKGMLEIDFPLGDTDSAARAAQGVV